MKMTKRLKELFAIYLTSYQIKLLKYLAKYDYDVKNENITFQVCLYETTIIITINHLSRQQCKTLLRHFKEHGRHRTTYLASMKRNKHAYQPTEGWYAKCPCEMPNFFENKPAGPDQPIKYLDDMPSSIRKP